MSDFLFARSQMSMSLAFHIVFAALGIGMPLLMALAEGMYLRTKQPVYLDLCKRWSKGTAILFAVGAVSGTVLSFELGLLWPGFMEHAGAIIGMPFSLEGFAFFTEAIFLGVYLYGWKRVSPLIPWLSGLVVAMSGIFSGIFVVTANAWMNSPAGFKIVGGKITDIDPIAAMLNPASFHEVLHMTLAAFVATGFMVAAVHAFYVLRDRSNPFHRAALGLALVVACIAMPLQILSGDASARAVARLQPAKLAAMEAHYRTQAGPPLGFLAIETGWVVTELGRQPWIIYGVMRTREAVTPMPGLVVPFVIFTGVYIFLAIVVAFLLRRQFLATANLVPAQPGGVTHA